MKSNGNHNRLGMTRVLWLFIFSILLAGTLNSVSLADGSSGGVPPSCMPDSTADTSYSIVGVPGDDPTLPNPVQESGLPDVSLIYDLVLLSLAV